VARERLCFTPKLPHDRYLALYRHVDLFLDTWPYGAHTTASDALYAGCPVLTIAGRTFAARVGVSLLTTLGLPELIARDPEDYLVRACGLIEQPAVLAEIRDACSRPADSRPCSTWRATRAISPARCRP
jgi:predicted O-linked N-acetylglucosamine transferase (SPINDLY family)